MYTLDLAQNGEVTFVTGLDLDVSITLDLCQYRIYINFHPLVVIFDGVSALISTEWWLIFYLFIYLKWQNLVSGQTNSMH